MIGGDMAVSVLPSDQPRAPMDVADLQAHCDALLSWLDQRASMRADRLRMAAVRALRDSICVHCRNMGWDWSVVVTITDDDAIRLLAVPTSPIFTFKIKFGSDEP